MSRLTVVCPSAAVLTLSLLATASLAAPPVTLELVVEQGAAVTSAHRWLELLKGLDATLRIRQAQPGDRVQVETLGSERSPQYRVTGMISRRDELRLPGATFRFGDNKGVERWLEKLRSGGEAGLTTRTGAFGLTEHELNKLHTGLATPLTMTTSGKPAREVIDELRDTLALELQVDPIAQATLDSGIVSAELQGVSTGTALAALGRPLGLVLQPVAGAGQVTALRMTTADRAAEFWPVGWPPPAKERANQLAPELFKFTTVEIQDISLSETLAAIQQRLEMPILLDQNSLAKHGIDPAAITVSLPEQRTYYKRVVERVLFQARLRSDLRVDEAGQPLLWVTTIKQ